MFSRIKGKSKAQSTAEYAILLGLVIAAAAAMQIYMKRGLQARVHDASKSLVNQTAALDAGLGEENKYQYEPYYLNSEIIVDRTTNAYSRMERQGNIDADSMETTGRRPDGYQAYEFNADTDQSK
ncbi:MAG: hypothetical protein ACOY3D_03835 [Candidatus Omnitrophota bacterium]